MQFEDKGNTTGTRKRIEDYSYNLSDRIGKGYSSTVYRGRKDLTSTLITRSANRSKSYRPQRT